MTEKAKRTGTKTPKDLLAIGRITRILAEFSPLEQANIMKYVQDRVVSRQLAEMPAPQGPLSATQAQSTLNGFG